METRELLTSQVPCMIRHQSEEKQVCYICYFQLIHVVGKLERIESRKYTIMIVHYRVLSLAMPLAVFIVHIFSQLLRVIIFLLNSLSDHFVPKSKKYLIKNKCKVITLVKSNSDV